MHADDATHVVAQLAPRPLATEAEATAAKVAVSIKKQLCSCTK
jgi:hypothetical protein